MINLLPTTEKEILKKGLKIRFFIVSVGLVFVAMFMGVVFLFPTYVLTSAKYSDVYLNNTSISGSDVENKKGVLELPNEIKNKLQTMEFVVNRDSIVSILGKFFTNMPSGVSVSSISFVDNTYSNLKKTKNKELTISGVAKNRNVLISFSDNLKKIDKVVSVDLPVSNFIKDNNIPFSLKVNFID